MSSRKPDVSPLLPDAQTLRARREALRASLDGGKSPGGRRPPLRLALALAALFVLGAGVAWATGVFSAKDVAVGEGIGCYSGPSLDANVAITHASADPLAKCARLWREGVIDVRRGPASPHLVACSKRDAGVFVFPGPNGLCARLGLEPLPSDYAPAGREAARAYTAWARVLDTALRIDPGNCRSPARISGRARTLLDRGGYGDIPVVVLGDGTCAERLEPRGRRIIVLTASREDADQQGLEGEARDVARPLIEAAIEHCTPPDKFATEVRRKLREAGIEGIAVRSEDDAEPCTNGSYGFGEGALVFFGAARKTWLGNRAGYRRAMRNRARSETRNHAQRQR